VAAIADVSLSIAAGSFVALVGASGSGKSTLLKTINRLVTPDSGFIEIGGQRTDAQPDHALRRQIGYVFQNVGLFPHMTVADNIGIGLKLRGQRGIQPVSGPALRPRGPRGCPMNCPAASASASAWRGRWPRPRVCC
jgi:osmoprotectant transport system ATP-binding protein